MEDEVSFVPGAGPRPWRAAHYLSTLTNQTGKGKHWTQIEAQDMAISNEKAEALYGCTDTTRLGMPTDDSEDSDCLQSYKGSPFFITPPKRADAFGSNHSFSKKPRYNAGPLLAPPFQYNRSRLGRDDSELGAAFPSPPETATTRASSAATQTSTTGARLLSSKAQSRCSSTATTNTTLTGLQRHERGSRNPKMMRRTYTAPVIHPTESKQRRRRKEPISVKVFGTEPAEVLGSLMHGREADVFQRYYHVSDDLYIKSP